MLVSRLQVPPQTPDHMQIAEIVDNQESESTLYIPAIDAIKDFIKTSTSSMTAVPKPLKFLMPHYEDLTKTYEEWPNGNEKVWRNSQGAPHRGTDRVVELSCRCLICSRHDTRG